MAMKLTDYTAYADAHREMSSDALWALFDGDRTSLNIAHGLGVDVVLADEAFMATVASLPGEYAWHSGPDDLAVFQYTSGTTRELPEAVRHSHRAIVVLMIAALYGTGIRPGDLFFCPSS